MDVDDHDLLGEEDALARHRREAEVLEGKRSLDWLDLESFLKDSHCLTPKGKQVAIALLATLKAFLKEKFLERARHTPEILTAHPFFALDFLPGLNDVPRVYADVFRFALQLHLLQTLERFRGMLKDTVNNLEAVR